MFVRKLLPPPPPPLCLLRKELEDVPLEADLLGVKGGKLSLSLSSESGLGS